jgi:hypothetical protein
VLLAASGCAKEAAGPTQEEYAAVANQVCKDSGAALDAIYMDHSVDIFLVAQGEEPTIYTERPERWVRVEVVPAYRGLAGALKGIQPPDGDYTYLTDLYADLDTLVEELHRVPSLGRAVIETDELLRERFASYGMDECPPAFDETPDWADLGKVAEAAEERVKEERGLTDE